MSPALPRPGGRRLRIGLVVLVVLVGAVLVGAAALDSSLSYYRTPTELVGSPPDAGQSLRLSGMVVPGSVHHRGRVVRFRITDGVNAVDVVSDDTPPSTFRPGQDAVVEGHLVGQHLFRADQVMVRHDNQYNPAGSGR